MVLYHMAEDPAYRAWLVEKKVVKALVDLFNQTTGGARDVYRGAFQGLDEMRVFASAFRRSASAAFSSSVIAAASAISINRVKKNAAHGARSRTQRSR